MVVGVAAAASLGVSFLAQPIIGASASASNTPARATAASSPQHASAAQIQTHIGFSNTSLHRLGIVDLSQADSGYLKSGNPYGANGAASTAAPSGARHVSPLGTLYHPNAAASATFAGAVPHATSLSGFGGNVTGESGIDGITAAINGGANSPDIGAVGDVTPPDQGLGVGPSPAGTALVEFVNDTLNIYSRSGSTLLGAVPAYQVFGLPPNAFLSDPRVYWDPTTGHWFLAMFTVGDGGTPSNGECSNGAAPPNCLSTQYLAVSVTNDPFGNYTIFSIDTSDSSNSANGCPCFGDYDMLGADASGIFISTNEFPLNSGGPGFNGSVIYAISKSGLISAANGGSTPPVERYTVPYPGDPFAGYHVSPSTVTEGSSNPNTEYFVESNANLPNSATANSLEVFALLHTNYLPSGKKLTMDENTVNTETYTELPPNATQKSGPTPLGTSVGFDGVPHLDSDFNAVQEVTYASGKLYAELDTGFAYKTSERDGAAWFVLHPTITQGTLGTTVVHQGIVETSQYLLYPAISVDKYGNGFMTFSVSGPAKYPSAAYVSMAGASGAGSVVHIAANGVAPLDTFDCYPYFGFSTGQCRWGDYSMAQDYNGTIYMATEYIAPQPRDVLANWATRVFWAPIGAS